MHRWWLNSSRREFGITIETTFTCLLDCRLVRYWVFFLQQRSCVKSWHSTAQLWLHVWGWGLKLTEGQKKRPGYSWIQMWHGLCTEQPGSWLSDCMCHFFFLVYFTVSLVLQCGLDHDDDKTASRQDWKVQLCIVILRLKDISGVSCKCRRCDSVSLYLTFSACDSEIGGRSRIYAKHMIFNITFFPRHLSIESDLK